MDQKKQKTATKRVCPACKGTGIEKTLHRRYTAGGRDDRRCKRCNGECYIGPDQDQRLSST
jgi:hypothetical protein